jgi:phosphoribosylformylglycinamidine (FGAM) synthase-like amidotransferase family enzyme
LTYKKDVLYEFYILIKHGNFSYGDVLHMPVFERRAFIDILMEENNKVKEHREREAAKISNKRK